MKKLALTVASAAVLASAANAAMEGKNFSGFYVGGHLGYGSGKTKIKDSTVGAQTNIDLGSNGVVGGLHVGFGKEFNNKLYLGLEAFGNIGKHEGKINAGTSNLKFKRENEFGAAFRPGFVCGNALLYVKAGVSSASWKLENHKKRKIAFVPGLGASFMASEHVVVGVEATHTMYKKHHEKGTNVKATARVTDVTGRVSYKW
ncbi:hypothetical protein IM40_04025 [Candidatus Paracaedimonas acanthamoebae]|nr:hypothetical protein IM40_04025 [Candidatus Paracaedimonas acanthamoebae]